MELTPYKSSKMQNGGPLKTTTWGALIAIALLLGLLGTTGYLFHSFGSPQVIQTAANTAPRQNASAPVARKHSYTNASGLGLNNSLTFEQPNGIRANGPVSANNPVAGMGVAAEQSNSSGMKAASTAQPDPLSGGITAGTANAQALIAAKIAPDLQGIDPNKPVDVIVQFKRSAASTDLSADGATLKSTLTVINAQLVTVQGANLNSLASHSEVAYISPDRKVRGAMDPVVTAVNAASVMFLT
jgi:hypothetical protein